MNQFRFGRWYLIKLVVAAACLSSHAQNWVLTSANTNYDWQGVACSTNAAKIVAVSYDDGYGNGGVVSTSTNMGGNWFQSGAPTNYSWQAVACSADGNKLIAVANEDLNGNAGPIYSSTNAGKTWRLTTAPTNYWLAVASSANGAKLYAVDSGSGKVKRYAPV